MLSSPVYTLQYFKELYFFEVLNLQKNDSKQIHLINFNLCRLVLNKMSSNIYFKYMKDIISSLADLEDSKTSILFNYFKDLSSQNFLNKEQLLKILMWKSPRPLNHYLQNSEEEIKEITTLAFSLTNDS